MMDALAGLYEGLYDPAGCDPDGERPALALEGEELFIQHLLRPVEEKLGDGSPFSAMIWMLPAGPDPRPIPTRFLARVVDALDSGGAVLLYGTEQAAIEAVKAAVLPMVGGAYA
jgi:hypothetical protein